MVSHRARLSIKGSTVANNTVGMLTDSSGGGIFVTGESLFVIKSTTLSGNSAGVCACPPRPVLCQRT
jgi:hypothetical protein